MLAGTLKPWPEGTNPERPSGVTRCAPPEHCQPPAPERERAPRSREQRPGPGPAYPWPMESGPALNAIDDESRLLERLRAGDDEAFETLVREQSGRMLAVARRILGNDDDAGDAVQDAFLSAFKALDRFEGGARLSTWLHRITVNAALMKLRSRRRRPERQIEDLLPRFDDTGHVAAGGAGWSGGVASMDADETRARVREKIEELPEDYRIVLILRDIEGLDTKQTATCLEISPAAVKTRLHRARQALRTLLEEDPG